MSSNSYEGLVGMKPEIEKSHFFSGDDGFTYKAPLVYFECQGDIEHFRKEDYEYEDDAIVAKDHCIESDIDPLQVAFDWRGDSVIVAKDNRVVRYTEFDYYELLMTDLEGQIDWVDGRLADIMGWDLKYASDIRTAKGYWIEEFDWNKMEKKKYKVILDETSKLGKYDAGYLKSVIDRDSKCVGEEYILRDLEN